MRASWKGVEMTLITVCMSRHGLRGQIALFSTEMCVVGSNWGQQLFKLTLSQAHTRSGVKFGPEPHNLQNDENMKNKFESRSLKLTYTACHVRILHVYILTTNRRRRYNEMCLRRAKTKIMAA